MLATSTQPGQRRLSWCGFYRLLWPRAGFAVLLLPVLFSPACRIERETTLMRASRARVAIEQRLEREQQERALKVWRQKKGETIEATDAARFEVVKASSKLRAAESTLRLELEELQRAEQRLAKARARRVEIDAELAPLLELDRRLADKEREIAAINERIKQLTSEVAKATASAAAQEAQLQPRLTALQGRLTALREAGVALEEVEQRIQAAAAVLAPPADPKQAPAKKPGK